MGVERRGENQKQKMLVLQRIFQQETDERHGLTIPEMIDRLRRAGVNADRKTLYQDFEELRRFGLDILDEQVGHQHYYYLGQRTFELPELKLLVDSVQAAKFMTDRKSGELISKLESLVSKYQGKQLQRQVIISGRVKTMNHSIYYNVDAIHSAINADRRIRFKYYQWNMRKELEQRRHGAWYEVSPRTLVWDDAYYYLVAFDGVDRQLKHYRLDKMKNIEMLDLPREGADALQEQQVAAYSKTVFRMYAGEERAVTLEAENALIGVLIDRFGKDFFETVVDEGHFRATVRVAVSPQFFGWLMALGPGIRIVDPPDVVEQMKQEISRLADQYGVT